MSANQSPLSNGEQEEPTSWGNNEDRDVGIGNNKGIKESVQHYKFTGKSDSYNLK